MFMRMFFFIIYNSLVIPIETIDIFESNYTKTNCDRMTAY